MQIKSLSEMDLNLPEFSSLVHILAICKTICKNTHIIYTVHMRIRCTNEQNIENLIDMVYTISTYCRPTCS
jgi:hypothetical protein